jgi:hypothetical protein
LFSIYIIELIFILLRLTAPNILPGRKDLENNLYTISRKLKMQSEAPVRNIIAIPDTEYGKLRIAAQMRGKRGYICNDKKGERHRFFMKGSELWGEHKVGDKLEAYETMSMTDALQKHKEMQSNPFKEHIVKKLKEDRPELTDEQIDANADIIVEANETIKRLIAGGMDPKVAHTIITGVLHSEETQEHLLNELKKKDEELKAQVLTEMVEQVELDDEALAETGAETANDTK